MGLNTVETKITVNGEPCDYVYMKLDQRMCGHHVFEIAVGYRHGKASVWSLTVDDIFRETLNNRVTITMTHHESGETNEFHGIVTDIEALGVDGDEGTVILRGGSPTILLDRDPAMGSFVDSTLQGIVAETLGNTAIEVELSNNPALKRTIPYVARYKESSFAFLSRLLYSFGEWFYYDGRKLVVGNPMEYRERRVTYDMELSEVRSMAGIRNLNARYYDYDPETDYYFEEFSGTIHNANLLMRGAKMASDPLYPTAAKLPLRRQVLGNTDMHNITRAAQSREYVKTSSFTAKCKTCGIKVGEVATVFIPRFPGVQFRDLGSFRVLEVRHRADKEGHYENVFTGIAAQSETLPDDHIVMPHAFPEPATVVSNDDPRHLGRVKVRYFWQGEEASTHWIRVQSPDAGGSGAVPKNRGMVFIPEVGDQVMVGFQYGDPGRPYVAGSLFHINNTEGAAAGNAVRTISTKSGHLIEFNDDDKSLHIEDPSGNTWDMDGKGNIVVNAPETITFIAKNMRMEVSEDLSMNIGNNVRQTIGNDCTLSVAGKSSVNSGDSVSVTASNNMEFKAGAALHIDTESEIITQARGNVLLNSSQGEMQLSSKGELSLKSNKNVHNAR